MILYLAMSASADKLKLSNIKYSLKNINLKINLFPLHLPPPHNPVFHADSKSQVWDFPESKMFESGTQDGDKIRKFQ